MSQDKSSAREAHWTKTRNLTIIILILWVIFSFVVHWMAKGLNASSFLGFPLGYYMAVQGSLAVFVALIFIHNKMQDKIDDEAGLEDKIDDEAGLEE
jgi:putative solute:sodium symporter small subunit